MIRSLPDSVWRYLDGGKADFDAASWALENNEVELFKQIHAEGFCFSPSQRQWHQEKKESTGHTQLATAAWPSVEYSCHEEIDSNNVHGLILLLGMSANFSTLKLNLSSRIDEQSLTELLNAIDALPRAPEVEIEIDSGCHGGIDRKLGFALASSKTCLSTPRVRSWIIQNMIHAIGNPENFSDRLQMDAQKESRSSQFYSEMNLHPERMRRIAAVGALNASALQAAPAAMEAFLANKGCPGTGRPITDTDADVLARTALYYREPVLQLAISRLAPHRKIALLKIPEAGAVKQLQFCKVPCEFKLDLAPEDVAVLSIRMKDGASIFTDATLTLVENFEPADLQELFQSICNLPKLDRLSFSINPEVTLDLGDLTIIPRDHEVGLLILNGAEKAGSNATTYLGFLNVLINPRALSIRAGTPGAAASMVTYLVDQIRQGERFSLEELDIHCTLPVVAGEPSLVKAIGDLLTATDAVGDNLENARVRTPQPTITDETEKNRFIQLAHRHKVEEDIKFEYFSSLNNEFQTYIHIESRPKFSEVAGAFFSKLGLPEGPDRLPRAFPPDIGAHAAEIALSPEDLQALALVSRATAAAANTASRKHTASVIVFELENGGHDVSSLSKRLSPHGELDQALASEVRAQLVTQALPDGVLALLNEVAPPKDA